MITIETIGEIIRKYRNIKDWSMQVLAEKAEITNPFIIAIENNQKLPSEETLTKIANALEIPKKEIYNLLVLLALEKTPEIIRKEYLEMKAQLERISTYFIRDVADYHKE